MINMPITTLTSKGRITLPKQLREQLRLQTGSRIEFVIEPSGRVVLKPLNADFRSLKGIVRSRRRRPVSVEEMNESIAKGYSGMR
jgi:AbrB family looped-hinge helix DNA binding protein